MGLIDLKNIEKTYHIGGKIPVHAFVEGSGCWIPESRDHDIVELADS